jgi:hypothetical protein
MKMFFAGVTMAKGNIKDWDNILLSYYNEFGEDIERYRLVKKEIDYKHLFIDSGAFSAFTQGVKIDIDKYIDFLKKVDKNDQYASLDVIGDAEKSLENWLYMKSKGLNPIPVIHYGSDKKYFDIYLREHRIKYLALGGLVPYTKKKIKLKRWLDYSFSLIKPYFPVKTHLFGVTSDWVLMRYPVYSCDSTGWLAGTKFNRVIKLKGLSLVEDTEQIKYNSSLRGKKGTIKNRKNIIEYKKFTNEVTKLWAKRGIVWDS